jgi:hypothetical protein
MTTDAKSPLEADQVLAEDVRDEVYVDDDSEFDQLDAVYRSMSKAAVGSLVLAATSLLGLLFPLLLVTGLFAVLIGLVGLKNIRRYPEELTGRRMAWTGIAGGLLLFVGGVGMHTYIYLTEVPPGYERITFSDLEVEEDAGRGRSGPALPEQLDGKDIFVKGYMHPGVADLGEIRQFILVPDMGTCCFGGQPALTDMIEVTIQGKRGLKYSRRKRKLAGKFHVSYQLKQVAGGLRGGYYELEADYAK